ncbi:SusC/RagA family TonB-linked outer membrane protein [Prevotella sp.]|uniref:SusC/RagA family TonB-linked outer membrane protein n=1 Tax=Prevotella sp. TaxID=59823 RepID=UPI0025EA75B4|nr:SusC/RagA family TonB-linked outer membrane protein [Prevotella sp.]
MKHNIFNKRMSLALASMLVASGVASAQEMADTTKVNVAFGQVSKADLMGGVSEVNVEELLKKDYSANALNDLQALIGGYNGNVWGQGALVLVDGVPREASTVNATEVEKVTVLKGASAVVLYGAKAAKGVILITTKRGKVQPLSIAATVNTGIYTPKAYPEYLGAAEYMSLYNEAMTNDDPTQPLKYSKEQIYNTAAGTNPYRYPDMDFYSSDYLRKFNNRTDATMEVKGGSQFARYYANLGMTYNNSLVKFGEHKKDKDYSFRVRSNIDATITDWLGAYVNVGINIADNYRGRPEDYWSTATSVRPNWYSGLLPISMMDTNNSALQQMIAGSKFHVLDGQYLLGGNNDNQATFFGDALAAGYVKNHSRTFTFDVGVKADLDQWVKGLSFETAFSIDYWNNYSEAYKLDYAVYEPTWANVNGQDMIIDLKKYGKETSSTTEYIGASKYYQNTTFRAQFDYKNTFGGVHNVNATLAGWGYSKSNSVDENHESSSGVKGSSYHRTTNANLALRAAYNYAQKYYAEFGGALVHSSKLAEGHRNALSPSGTLGWRIGQEKWFKDAFPCFDDLKLNASYSVLNQDIDISDYYLYQGYYDVKGGYYTWNEGGGNGTYSTLSKRGSNYGLDFVKRKEWRAGLEGSLLNGTVSFDMNYFHQLTSGLLTSGTATIYPSWMNSDGSFITSLNYNEDLRQGFDFAVNFKKNIGKVKAQLGLTGMVFDSKVNKREEKNEYSYMNAQGQALDVMRGYVCEGFFTQEDVDHMKANLEKTDPNFVPNHTFGEIKAGDLKYKDINGDGKIDSNDQQVMGKYGWNATPFFYGVNITLNWKQFTLFIAGTGQMGAKGFKSNDWIYNQKKYTSVVRRRWTPETAATATYPRLTAKDNTNNFRNSNFWIYSTDRFNLNKVQLTYDMPNEWFENKVVKGMSVYVLGESLLTISKNRKYMETSYGSPQCRFYNLGLKMMF